LTLSVPWPLFLIAKMQADEVDTGWRNEAEEMGEEM
jgi:hypothetical protein